MDKSSDDKKDLLKVASGVVLFLSIGLFITSPKINLPADVIKFILQVFIIAICIGLLSLKGYYFSSPENPSEFIKKYALLSLFLGPTALMMFGSPTFQMVNFCSSLMLTISIVFIHNLNLEKAANKFLIFLTTLFILIRILVLLNTFSLLPEAVKDFFKAFFLLTGLEVFYEI